MINSFLKEASSEGLLDLETSILEAAVGQFECSRKDLQAFLSKKVADLHKIRRELHQHRTSLRFDRRKVLPRFQVQDKHACRQRN